MMKDRIILYVLVSLFSLSVYASITSKLDQATVALGETVHLTITIDDSQTQLVPDLTPLQRDFSIVGSKRSMVYTIINNHPHSVNEWIIALIPNKTGQLTIPALQVGNQQTNTIILEVTERPPMNKTIHKQIADKDNKDVILTGEISQSDPFVNQKILYVVKLYSKKTFIDADYQHPTMDHALIIPLGNGIRSQESIDGSIYHVEEQHYAIFPQKSGKLELQGPVFNAIVYDTIPQRVHLRGKNIELTVKPVPASYAGKQWLPAKEVALSEQYDYNEADLLEGRTMIRTITMQVKSVPGQLLPEFTLPKNPQYSSYTDSPVLDNVIKQHELIGKKTIKITYLFNKPGKVTIPALQLPWFNIDTGQQELAMLPARELTIATKASLARTADSPLMTTMPKKSVVAIAPMMHDQDYLAWSIAGLFASAWIVTLMLWSFQWWRYSKDDLRLARLRLYRACSQNDPSLAQSALLLWAQSYWPDVRLTNLADIAKLTTDDQLKSQISQLTACLYTDTTMTWQGKLLWHCIARLPLKKQTIKCSESELPPINPR
ncbi:MAG: BatD family protein [Legionella sp.]